MCSLYPLQSWAQTKMDMLKLRYIHLNIIITFFRPCVCFRRKICLSRKRSTHHLLTLKLSSIYRHLKEVHVDNIQKKTMHPVKIISITCKPANICDQANCDKLKLVTTRGQPMSSGVSHPVVSGDHHCYK